MSNELLNTFLAWVKVILMLKIHVEFAVLKHIYGRENNIFEGKREN